MSVNEYIYKYIINIYIYILYLNIYIYILYLYLYYIYIYILIYKYIYLYFDEWYINVKVIIAPKYHFKVIFGNVILQVALKWMHLYQYLLLFRYYFDCFHFALFNATFYLSATSFISIFLYGFLLLFKG